MVIVLVPWLIPKSLHKRLGPDGNILELQYVWHHFQIQYNVRAVMQMFNKDIQKKKEL